MTAARHLQDRGHREPGAADRGQHRAPGPRRPLSRADLLDVRRRAPPDRRPAAGRLRHARVVLPVHRDDRLSDRAPAGVPRRRPAARARDDRRRGSAREPGLLALPALRLRDPIGLPAVSELHAQAQGALLLVLEADRPGLADVPVLRGGDDRADAVVDAPPAAPDDRSVDGRGRGRAARARGGRNG